MIKKIIIFLSLAFIPISIYALTLDRNREGKWKLSDNAGDGTWYDDTDNNNDLSGNNTPTASTGHGSGSNLAVNLQNGNLEYLNISDGSQTGLDITGAMSISAWIRLDASAPASNLAIISKWKGQSNQRSYVLMVGSAGNARFLISGTGAASNSVSGGTTLTKDGSTWHHIVGVYTGNWMRLYVDNSSDATPLSYSGGVFDSDAEISIGTIVDSGGSRIYHFDGDVDDVQVWSKDLSVAEVTELYNAGDDFASMDNNPEGSHFGGMGSLDGTGAFSGGASAPGRDFFFMRSVLGGETVHNVRVRWSSTLAAGKKIRFKVWRDDPGNSEYDVVGVSEEINAGGHSGKNTYDLGTTITATAGDFIGIFMDTAAGGLEADSNNTLGLTRFMIGNALSGSVAYTSWTTTNGDGGIEALTTNVPTLDYMIIGDSIAEGHPDWHSEEHLGPTGNPNEQIAVWLDTELGQDQTWYNAGIGGEESFEIVARIDALFDIFDFTDTYLIVGANDIGATTDLEAYLSDLDTILTSIETTGSSDMIMCQIFPISKVGIYPEGLGTGTLDERHEEHKFWNAAIEKWCILNDVELAPTYQEMCETNVANEDNLESDYNDGDNVHLSEAGNTRAGELLASPGVPDRTRTWGNASFDAWGHEGWSWFILGGSSLISGDGDTGTLVLPQNDDADSPVKCIEEEVNQTRTITITSNISAGTINTYYRTSANNFDRNDGAGWTSYSSSFSMPATHQFIQVRFEGGSVSDANVDDAIISWTSGEFIEVGRPRSVIIIN